MCSDRAVAWLRRGGQCIILFAVFTFGVWLRVVFWLHLRDNRCGALLVGYAGRGRQHVGCIDTLHGHADRFDGDFYRYWSDRNSRWRWRRFHSNRCSGCLSFGLGCWRCGFALDLSFQRDGRRSCLCLGLRSL
ncbi:hypothetical protein KPSA1_07475 [Pseudomonas syringae pv. actinidiae]|uniref:Uncharacterized protein n=1 Tax=Pseudomonas syringae pv. actinidiae TaxID=103796 RepID=A0A2V0QZD3_PSESF|nr:hypothetical protein KPSA1_07475 [Pseudomonas syringae pv. actinidiae]